MRDKKKSGLGRMEVVCCVCGKGASPRSRMLDGACESEYGDDKFRIEGQVGMLPCSAVLEAGLCHTDGSRGPHLAGGRQQK